MIANLEDDKRLLSEQLQESDKKSTKEIAYLKNKVADLEREKSNESARLNQLYATGQESDLLKKQIRAAKETNETLQHKIHQVEEQKRIAKESFDMAIKAKDATISTLTAKMNDLNTLLREPSTLTSAANNDDDDLAEEVRAAPSLKQRRK